MDHVHYNQCPVCHSSSVNSLLTVKDHSVSGESFEVWQCAVCSLRFTQNVPDESSIGPYYQSADYISHTNTSEGLINRMYQRVRKFTLEQKANMVIKRTTEQGNVLDIGAGIGAFLHAMKEKGWKVTGLEPDQGARERAAQLFGIELQDVSVLHQLEQESFDAITLWHVLEHVHQLHPYIEQLKKLLRPGGKILIAVPNYQSLDSSIYGVYWAAYDVPRHLYHFSPLAMQTLMEQHGLKILEKKRMWFDSFYISLLSSKYKNGKSKWIGAGISGLRSNLKALFNKDACSSLIYVVGK